MKLFFRSLLLIAALALPSLAAAQSSPNLVYGQVPTAAQWNSYFAAKQDTLGYNPVNRAGDSMLGKLIGVAPTTSTATINLPPGVAPSAPVNGDMWTTSLGVYVRINGSTVGPLASSASTTLTVGSTVVNSGTDGYTLYNNAGVLGNRQYVPLANGGTNNGLTASNGGIVYSDASKLVVLPGTVTPGQCLLSGSSSAPSWGSCVAGTTVSDVTAANASVTVTPTTGNVTVALNLSNANTWAARQTFGSGATFPIAGIRMVGSSTGYTDFSTANAGASNYTITFPAATGTVALTSGVVSSIAGNVGAFTVSTGITNATNDIRLDVPVLASRGGTGVVSPTANTIPVNQGASAQTALTLTPAQCVAGNASSVPTAVAGCRVLLATYTGTSQASLGSSSILTSAFAFYDVEFDLTPAASGGNIGLQVYSGSYRTTGYQTVSNGIYSNSATAANLPTTYIPLSGGNNSLILNSSNTRGYLKLFNPSAAAVMLTVGMSVTAIPTSSVIAINSIGGAWATSGVVTGFQVINTTGNITGTVRVYGYN